MDEFTSLSTTEKLETDRNLLLYRILDTTAHGTFVQCLGEEHSHPYREQLFRQLISGLDKSLPKKRTREDTKCVMITSPEKRYPSQLKLHEVLATQKYAKIVRSWRSWVSNGDWNETERAEMEYLQDVPSKYLPLKIAVLLQSAIARIFRKEYPKAEELLKKCDGLNEHVEGDIKLLYVVDVSTRGSGFTDMGSNQRKLRSMLWKQG